MQTCSYVGFAASTHVSLNAPDSSRFQMHERSFHARTNHHPILFFRIHKSFDARLAKSVHGDDEGLPLLYPTIDSSTNHQSLLLISPSHNPPASAAEIRRAIAFPANVRATAKYSKIRTAYRLSTVTPSASLPGKRGIQRTVYIKANLPCLPLHRIKMIVIDSAPVGNVYEAVTFPGAYPGP